MDETPCTIPNEWETSPKRRRSKKDKVSGKVQLVVSKLYKMGKAIQMLRYVGKSEITLVLMKVHKSVCISHIGGASMFFLKT